MLPEDPWHPEFQDFNTFCEQPAALLPNYGCPFDVRQGAERQEPRTPKPRPVDLGREGADDSWLIETVRENLWPILAPFHFSQFLLRLANGKSLSEYLPGLFAQPFLELPTR